MKVQRFFPIRKKNQDLRPREYLTAAEVEQLVVAAKKIGRHGLRDSTMIYMAYRHALRAKELVRLKWSQVDLQSSTLHVQRLKNGINTVHPISINAMRSLRQIKKKYTANHFVFVSERQTPMTVSNFRKMVIRAGREASLSLSVHPHMLRHATGYKLANDGHDTRTIQVYMGHRNIQHTTIYTDLCPNRFHNLWND